MPVEYEKEYEKALKFTYNEYVEYLLNKYGHATHDYFSKLSYDRFKNNQVHTLHKLSKVSRTSEGLYVHHIDEDKQILISTPADVKNYDIPFEYQTANRLVYCNLIEHAILHIHIAIEQQANQKYEMNLGIGGYVNFIRPELVEWLIDGNKPMSTLKNQQWRKHCYNAIYMPKNNFQHLLDKMDDTLINNYPITKDDLEFLTEIYKIH